MSPLFGKKKTYPNVADATPTTSDTKTFEGRPLAKQGEDLEDQGLVFDLGTLVSRRRALGIGGIGVSSLLLAACGTQGTGTTQTASASSSASASATAARTFAGEMPTETAGGLPRRWLQRAGCA